MRTPPPEIKLSLYSLLICLPLGSVMSFLRGAPLLRKILNPPLESSTFVPFKRSAFALSFIMKQSEAPRSWTLATAVASNRPTEALVSAISFTFVVYSHYKHS